MASKQAGKQDERLEAMHEALVAKTKTLTTSEGWLGYLDFAAKFHQYSLNNTLLILLQCPEATRVASYRKWSELGRQVRKGEKSLVVFAPMTRRKTDKETGEEKRYVSGFRLVPVFDVAQTDGEDLPEPIRPVLLDGQAPEGLWDALAGLVADHGYTLRFGPSERGENGYTSPSEKVIQITEGLSDAQRTKTLTHEIGHLLLHCDGGDLTADCMAHRGVAEVEAESVAYIVTQAHGMASDSYSLPYVSGWSNGDHETVAKTAARVLTTSKQILAHTQPEQAEVAA